MTSEPLTYVFRSLTQGQDEELDMMSVCFEALGRLKHGHEVERVLKYLDSRFSKVT